MSVSEFSFGGNRITSGNRLIPQSMILLDPSGPDNFRRESNDGQALHRGRPSGPDRQMRPAWEGDRIRLDMTGETWGVRTYLGSMQLSGISGAVDCAEVYVCRD
jgi:hypothetical protein